MGGEIAEFRFQQSAITCLQEATEAWAIGLFADATLGTILRKRNTLTVEDMRMAMIIRGERDRKMGLDPVPRTDEEKLQLRTHLRNVREGREQVEWGPNDEQRVEREMDTQSEDDDDFAPREGDDDDEELVCDWHGGGLQGGRDTACCLGGLTACRLGGLTACCLGGLTAESLP